MKLTRIIQAVCIICILLNSKDLFGQVRGGLGEGKVTIGFYNLAKTNSAKLDTSGRLFIKCTYYIKNQKIRRKADSSSLVNNSISKESNVTATVSVSMFEPDYLIDLSKKIVYTFKDTPVNKRGSIDSLKMYTDDIFYRFPLLQKTKETVLNLDTSLRKEIKMLGMTCYMGKVKFSEYGIWLDFVYTKRPLSFVSPLSGFIPGFSYPILNINLPINDPENPKHVKGLAFFCITSFNQEKQDDILFSQNK